MFSNTRIVSYAYDFVDQQNLSKESNKYNYI